jgi:DNA polymerase-3 subunit alpha
MLGFYITGHPLAKYEHQIKQFSSCTASKLKQKRDGDIINMAAMIVKIKLTTTRSKGEKMTILKLEDLEGAVEAINFPSVFKEVFKYLIPNQPVFVKGKVNLKEDIPKILVSTLFPLEEAYKLLEAIHLNLSGVRENVVETLKDKFALNSGNIPVYLHFDTPSKHRIQVIVGEELFVRPDQKLIKDIEDIIGPDKLSFVLQ